MSKFTFRTPLAEEIFRKKYANGPNDSWPQLARRVVEDVCGTRWGTTSPLMADSDREELVQKIINFQFIPGGRYLYYAGRQAHFWNNCFCLACAEDTREEWGALAQRATLALMSGGGIGVDYSILRGAGFRLSRTGGVSSGPIPLMRMVNEVGRNVMQGGSRRSAIWAGLNWKHPDIQEFMQAKQWSDIIKQMKALDFDFPAPLDMTNTSIIWDTDFMRPFLEQNILPSEWFKSVELMAATGEPGHAYNFYSKEKETLRNACAEFISDRDSDVCNLGSVNLANISSLDELKSVVNLGSKFLVCGTIRADLPYDKVWKVRNEYRKIGLGLMGIHEWLLSRGYSYEVSPEFREWLTVYRDESERSAKEHASRLYLATPRAYRAIAPNGTTGILAGTTTGIEPIYSVAYKRRYLDSTKWKYQFVIDPTAERIIGQYGLHPDKVETALSLAKTPEKRIAFQAEVQKFVDMGISSTINLPTWGTEFNNPTTAKQLAHTIAEYAINLRGLTCYPDGSRGGQPITEVPYEDAKARKGTIYEENEDVCVGGVCGL